MIIACPECTQPFQVEDGEIAPLVQVECPHCAFRMILDFEAANDASLIEVGMQMAQGFSSEADYRIAVGGGEVSSVGSSPAARLQAVPELEVAAVPEPEPVIEPEPEPVIEKPPVRVPPTEPALEKPPVRMPRVAEPTPEVEVEVEPEPEVEKPPVRVRRATFEPAPEPQPVPVAVREPAPQPTRARPTLIAHTAPPPALVPPSQSGIPAMVDEPGTPVPIEREVEVEVELDEEDVQTKLLPSLDVRHSPPHTPPVLTPVASGPTGAELMTPGPSEVEAPPTAGDSQSRPVVPEINPDARKPSVIGILFKILLLLLLLGVAGVMVWSLIETGNPNPLPLLQEKFGISVPGM